MTCRLCWRFRDHAPGCPMDDTITKEEEDAMAQRIKGSDVKIEFTKSGDATLSDKDIESFMGFEAGVPGPAPEPFIELEPRKTRYYPVRCMWAHFRTGNMVGFEVERTKEQALTEGDELALNEKVMATLVDLLDTKEARARFAELGMVLNVRRE